jgi:hypothetical protein
MRTVKIALPILALLMLPGCIAIPAGPGYYGAAPGYDAPAPAYYAPPAYYGPSFGISVYGGRRGHGFNGRRRR